MNRLTRLFLIACLLSIAPNSNAEDTDKFVGALVPLTGPLASYGIAMQNGILLAEEELPNLSESCPIKIEDSQYDPKHAIAAYRRLNIGGKMSYFYAFGGPIVDSLAPESERASQIFFTSESESKFAEGRKYVVRIVDTSEEHIVPLLKKFEDRGQFDLTVLRTDNQYIEGIYRALKMVAGSKFQVHELGIDQPGEKDFRA